MGAAAPSHSSQDEWIEVEGTDGNKYYFNKLTRETSIGPPSKMPSPAPRGPTRQLLSSAPSSLPQVSLNRVLLLLALWLFSVFCWIKGAFLLPTLEVYILSGTPFSSFYKRSLFLTLVDLYHQKTYFAVAALGFCSIVVPSSKLLATLYLIVRLASSDPATIYAEQKWLISTLSFLSSYQLLDLYVGVLFVAYFNSDSTHAEFMEGFYWYFTYCMCSMVMSVVLDGSFYEAMVESERPPDSPKSPVSLRRDASQDGIPVFVQPFVKPVHSFIAALYGRSAPNSPTGSRSSRDGVNWEAEELELTVQLRLPNFVDVKSVLLLSIMFFASLLMCYRTPVMEMRTVWEGVTVDKSLHAPSELFCSFLPSKSNAYVALPLFLMNLVVPIVYVAAVSAVAVAFHTSTPQEWKSYDLDVTRACCHVADLLRPWSTTDVFCFASIVFLFCVQDGRTLTTPMLGAYEYYYWLAVGFTLFFMRWWPESGEREARGCGIIPLPRFWITIFVLLAVCWIISNGHQSGAGGRGGRGGVVPHAASHLKFDGLGSVCAQGQPILETVLRSAVPATFGNCTAKDTSPPMPCDNVGPLYKTQDDDGRQYIEATWIWGVNQIKFSSCNLQKIETSWDDGGDVDDKLVTYRLVLGGWFENIKLYLHVKQCPSAIDFLGCTSMDSDDHCCGSNIHFNFTFDLGCEAKKGFRKAKLSQCDLDPMYVGVDFMDGAISIKALDIAGRIEDLLTGVLSGFMMSPMLKWAGKMNNIPQLINELIHYNAQDSEGVC